ncbi:MAG TPA: T9SS type A sorting domain-containing protein, partial [Bacteroidia bacterium]
TLPTSLQRLSCAFNSLTSLPTLPNSLQVIYAAVNNLTSLPSLPNSMYFLNVTSNSVASLPAFLPLGLVYLWVGNNQLTSLPNLPNTIQYFGCDYNGISSIPNLPTSLKYFYCYNNYLTSLPPIPSTLLYLECEDNNLTSLPALPFGLQTLFCDHNNITCFPPFPNSITSSYFNIDPNSYNCLPNYITAMSASDLGVPLCAAGNSNGCPTVTGIEQYANSNEVSLYPNPASSSLQVTFSGNIQNTTLQITDMLGNTVKQVNIKTEKTSIDVSYLAEGIYNISISSNEGVVNKRLVIVR